MWQLFDSGNWGKSNSRLVQFLTHFMENVRFQSKRGIEKNTHLKQSETGFYEFWIEYFNHKTRWQLQCFYYQISSDFRNHFVFSPQVHILVFDCVSDLQQRSKIKKVKFSDCAFKEYQSLYDLLSRCSWRLTCRDDLFNQNPWLVGHVAQHRKDGEPSEDAGSFAQQRQKHSVSGV